MREIKFRAYVKNNERLRENFEKEYKELLTKCNGKFMLDVLLIDWNNEMVDLEYGNIEIPFKDVEILQYTGSKDRNNVEIYEGDIVEFNDQYEVEKNNYESFTNNAVVKYKDGCFYLDDFRILEEAYDDLIIRHSITKVRDVKFVIGNIYENPELLKGEE